MDDAAHTSITNAIRALDDTWEALADAATVYDDGLNLTDLGPTIEQIHLALLRTLAAVRAIAVHVGHETDQPRAVIGRSAGRHAARD